MPASCELHGRECWRDIPGYEGFYQASTLGRVRSVSRMAATWFGQRSVHGRILVPWKVMQSGGSKVTSLQVDLSRHNRIKSFCVHKLILLTFVGPPPVGMVCCHGDGKPWHNCLANIRWDTHKANEADKLLHGTDNRAENIRGVNRWSGVGCKANRSYCRKRKKAVNG